MNSESNSQIFVKFHFFLHEKFCNFIENSKFHLQIETHFIKPIENRLKPYFYIRGIFNYIVRFKMSIYQIRYEPFRKKGFFSFFSESDAMSSIQNFVF